MQLQRLSQTATILTTGLFIAVFHNFAYFRNIAEYYSADNNLILTLVSTGVLHACVLVIILSLAGIGRFLKIFLALLLVISSVTAYFSDNFNVIIDNEMLINVIQTNPGEAFDLVTVRLVAYVLFLGILPAIFVYRLQFPAEPIRKLLLKRVALMSGSAIVIFVTIFSNSDFFASFLREQKELKSYANPTKSIESVFKLVSASFTSQTEDKWNSVALDAHKPVEDEEYELLVLVIGETARAENFSLNGYPRLTNPKLEQQKVISFTNIQSCGTTTAVSVPCMFSFLDRENYDRHKASNMDNLLDVLKRSGVSILWRDNNTGSKGVADRVEYQSFQDPETNPVCDVECRDVGMLNGLDEWVEQHPGKDLMIVLHQFGSHGPAYYKRYPSGFAKFQPTCESNQLDQCTEQEILNTYDNTILYTDYFLDKVINWLKKKNHQYEVSMLYVSDHGESLGESGLYLHGFPYSFAPDYQTHVPAILWGGENNEDIDFEKINSNRSVNYTHDNLSQTLLGLFEVQSQSYQPAKDILKYHYRYQK